MRCSMLVIALFAAGAAGAAGCLTEAESTPPELEVQLDQTEQNVCGSFCANGDFVCPPNPLMECYFFCTEICFVCDGEPTTCHQQPLP